MIMTTPIAPKEQLQAVQGPRLFAAKVHVTTKAREPEKLQGWGRPHEPQGA